MSDLGKVLQRIKHKKEHVAAKGFEHVRKEEHKEARECGFVMEGLDLAIAEIRRQFDINDPR